MDALLGGIEVLRHDLGNLIEMAEVTAPGLAEALEDVDGMLEEIQLDLEPAGDEELHFIDDGDLELFSELRADGMLTPADIDYFAEEE
jgi:hypothetical protein